MKADAVNDGRRPVVQEPSGGVRLSTENVARLAALAASERTDLFAALVTVAAVLVHRYVGWDRVEIGTYNSFYERPDVADDAPLSAMSLISIDLAGDPTFALAVSRVGATTASGAFGHEPLLLMRISLQSARQRHSLVPRGVSAEPSDSAFATISLSITRNDVGMQVACIGAGDDQALRSRIERQFVRLAESAAADSMTRISQMDLLHPDERHQLIVEWNQTDCRYPDGTVHELFEAQAAATPDADALRCAGEVLTYRQLDVRASQLAHYLRHRHVRTEVPVAVCLERSIDAIVAILAVLKAGGTYVPIDPRHPPIRVAEMLRECAPLLVVTRSDRLAAFERSGTPAVCLDTDAAAIAAAPIWTSPALVTPDHAAYILYTSGSAGRPKPIVGTHRSITNGLCDVPFRRDDPEEICCIDTSLNFGFSLARTFLPLLCGRVLVVLPDGPERDLVSLVGFWESERVGNIGMVTPVCRQLIGFGTRLTSRLKHVRTVLVGGSLTTPDLMAALFELMPQAELRIGYASSEVGGPIVTKTLTPGTTPISSSMGRPFPNTRVYLLDSVLQPVPIGVVGEIYVEAARLSRGYLNQPSQTAERYVANPFASRPGERFYRTGDLGRYLANGELELLGRVDDMVKVRGFRIELQEIEAVLSGHRNIDAVAVAVREVSGEPQVVAYVVGRGGAPLRAADLRAFVAERLPEYMVPARFVSLEKIPLTPLGKVDRAELPPVGAERPALDSPYDPPRTSLEVQLVQMWESLLDIHGIGVDDDFIELGGDSMFAAMLTARICDRYNIDMSVAALFERPTVRSMAMYLQPAVEANESGGTTV